MWHENDETERLTNAKEQNLEHDLHSSRKKRSIALFALLSLQIVLSIIKLILSVLWEHSWGIALSVIVLSTSLIGFIIVWKSVPVSKFLRLLFLITSTCLTFWLFFLLLIQLMQFRTNDDIHAFPNSCKKLTNCCRLTPNPSFNNDVEGLSYPSLPASSFESLERIFSGWIKESSGSHVVYQNSRFIHTRFLTTMWGFADDFYIQFECVPATNITKASAALYIQSESRLGKGDFGVNNHRVKQYLKYLAEHTGELSGTCL